MTRRIILVDPFWTRDKDPRVPLGHASLLAALRASGDLDLRSVVVPVNGERAFRDLADLVLSHTAGCAASDVDVAVGCYVWGDDMVRALLRDLRRRGFAGRIVLGGPQISYAGSGLEALYPQADAFVRGSGEEALAALAATPLRAAVPGVHWAGTPDAQERVGVALESLASPWLSGVLSIPSGGFVRWETQRGCPFRCGFCQHREPGARQRRRELALPRLEAEIDLFCEGQVAEIAVLDPVFNAAPHAAVVLRRFADRSFRGRLSLQCRAETLDDGFLDAASGLRTCLGLGLQTIHADEGSAIRRRNDIEAVGRTLAALRRRQTDHEVSLIFGLPRQTLASFEQSVRWCLERDVPVIKAFPLLLLRGTPLDRERARWGLVTAPGPMQMVRSSGTFTASEWRAMARLSAALRLTEGRHPPTLEALRALASTLVPPMTSWEPAPATEAW